MDRIKNDKYYTPVDLANYCFSKTVDIIGIDNISEIIEPSCGDGSFYHYSILPDKGYDIEPECNYDGVTKADYLSLNISYKPNRLIIGNPPFGRRLSLAQKFYKKSCMIADYIAFILPIGQLNNTQSLIEFDLIYSEDLGKYMYTDRELHCCFNIYRRPQNGTVNTKPKEVLSDIKIYRQDIKGYEEKPYDIRMCYWGDGSAGKILSEDEHYSAEYKILILNKKLKPQIIKILSEFNWSEYLNCIASSKIQQYHIINVLKQHIEGMGNNKFKKLF
jgi:hypothetical protein